MLIIPRSFVGRRLFFAANLFAVSSFTALTAIAQTPNSSLVNEFVPEAAIVSTDAERQVATRIALGRSLAASGNYAAAVRELESARATAANSSRVDGAVRDVASVLLMSVYVEQGDYGSAIRLLDEFNPVGNANNRIAGSTYYALAGQLIKSVRGRFERYGTYNVKPTDDELAGEAVRDLGGMGNLLERLMQQAAALQQEVNAVGSRADAAALFENAAGVRLSLARNSSERTRWQQELATARQRLAAAEPRLNIKGIRNAPANRRTEKDSSVKTAPQPSATNAVPVNQSTAVNPLVPTNQPASQTPAPTFSATPAASRTRTAVNPDVNSTTNSVSPVSGSAVAISDKPLSAPAPNVSAATVVKRNPTSSGSALPIEVGSLVDKATLRVSPSYPSTARSARVSGVVTVRLVINEQGGVESVVSTNGPEMLRRAAEDAAKRWRFRPTMVDGQPTRVAGFVSFNFAL